LSTDKESFTKDIEIELENLQRLTHIYGFNLKWEQFSQLCYHLKDLTEKLKQSLIDFFKAT
jgi:hypothetical protein